MALPPFRKERKRMLPSAILFGPSSFRSIFALNILLYNVWQIAVHYYWEGSEMPQAAYATKRSARLDARVSQKEKDLIEAAAGLRGVSITDFLRTTVTDAAHRIIRESELLTLSERSRKIFVQALLNPPKPNDAAIAAARRFKQEVR